MSELPDNLLEEIFFHVPATSLNRFRSTCKRWNRLLKDRVFTKNHLDKAPKQFQSLMLKASGVCLMRIDNGRFTVKGEARLTDPYSRADKIKIMEVSHCDGLLLCYMAYSHRLVVWNPCTGQTKWIRPRSPHEICCTTYALGSYQDKGSNGNSYKILRNKILLNKQEFEICEINSNSWRVIDVTMDFKLEYHSWVSLKGKTYWIGNRLKTDQSETFKCIISFDYTTEIFETLCLLPYQSVFSDTPFLSVVREEKLVVLLQRRHVGEKTEIWVTNKINETKEVSWTKVLAFDFHPPLMRWVGRSFVYDEEKKVLVFPENREYETIKVYIVGEDTRVRQLELEDLPLKLRLFSYVPSLIRLPHDIRRKRKRG